MRNDPKIPDWFKSYETAPRAGFLDTVNWDRIK